MTLKEVAEQKAQNYVKYALGESPHPEEAFTAKEDYVAGFINGTETGDLVLEYCKKQLNYVMNHAQGKGEYETVALLRHVIEKMIK